MSSLRDTYAEAVRLKKKSEEFWRSFFFLHYKSKRKSKELFEQLKVIICPNCDKSIVIDELDVVCPLCDYSTKTETTNPSLNGLGKLLSVFTKTNMEMLLGVCINCKRVIEKMPCPKCGHVINLTELEDER